MNLLTLGTVGAKTAGSLWGTKPVSSETDIQGEVREPVGRSFLSQMTPDGGGGSSFIMPLAAIGGLALIFILKD